MLGALIATNSTELYRAITMILITLNAVVAF